ncbi:RNA methyltransferase [Cohnella sp.]|uniref:RNA methyltransferase n=1 Tax=Cohnella sp. TaxID=1883426 RepID=UPI00356A1011
MDTHKQRPEFIYTYASIPEERSLCQLELRTLFGTDLESTGFNLLKSNVCIDPSRSPYVKERIEIQFEGNNLDAIVKQVSQVTLNGDTFKVIGVKTNDRRPIEKIQYKEQREIEKEVGSGVQGVVDVHKPDRVFGIVTLAGRWYFGEYRKNRTVWLQRVKKPRGYSMALPTRVARAVANIAVPIPLQGITAIDPCCGIGTVLVEALSMGIDIVGREINPLVARGARENLAYYDLEGKVTLGSIADITEHYDVAIVDMPYNLVSKISPKEQLSLLQHARRIASRVVIISIEDIDDMITNAGFTIIDYGVANKGSFSRYIMLCV